MNVLRTARKAKGCQAALAIRAPSRPGAPYWRERGLWRHRGRIRTSSHILIVRPAAAFRRYPGNVAVRVLDIASLAVDAVLRVDDVTRLTRLFDPLIDTGRAVACGRPGIDIVLRGELQRRPLHPQVNRLIFLVIRVRQEYR